MSPDTHRKGGWVCPTAGLYFLKEKKAVAPAGFYIVFHLSDYLQAHARQ
jgi:hypothetical protein